jgi:hypothetical protein
MKRGVFLAGVLFLFASLATGAAAQRTWSPSSQTIACDSFQKETATCRALEAIVTVACKFSFWCVYWDENRQRSYAWECIQDIMVDVTECREWVLESTSGLIGRAEGVKTPVTVNKASCGPAVRECTTSSQTITLTLPVVQCVRQRCE